MRSIHIFILVFVFAVCLADKPNPLKDPKICGRPQCDDENTNFFYNQSVHYKYDYKSHVRTEFEGSGQNTSNLYVTALLTLTFPTKCEGVLQIDNVNLYDRLDERQNINKHSNNFANEVQKNELRFSFHDGVINEVCPETDEPIWSLNFKRGILSSLQNSMTRFDIDFATRETDVSGTCDVKYVILGPKKTSLVIQKTKDITSCSNRYKTNSVVQTTPYEFRNHYTAWPILQSHSYCNITVDHNVYQEVTCFERHQLVPFSNNDTGAITTSTITLTLADEEGFRERKTFDDRNIKLISKRESLLFNHVPTPKPTSGEIRNARLLLQKMCKLGFPDIKKQFIDSFTKFLQAAKHLKTSALVELLRRAPSVCQGNENGRKHILESLPYIGSSAAIKMMIDEIVNKRVPSDTIQKWLTSISFTPRPDQDVLVAMLTLLEHVDSLGDASIVLAPSAVVNTFCRHHSDCNDVSQVKQIVNHLETKTIEMLSVDLTIRKNREMMIYYMKALGNTGHLSEFYRIKMQELILNENIPTTIRLYAITSHRRDECLQNRDFFLNVYRNFFINTEVRIAVYLQIMRCPDYILMRHIKLVLENEELNQVGSYVWSHLNNIAKSASPVRVEAQGLIGDIDLGNKFNLDMRKFSRNYEHSLFFDQYNVGASSETNIIFGTDSFMPRSASLNFTVDLFGESVNVFEIDAHIHGFEHLFEGMFGPKGPMSTQGFSEKVEAVTNYVKEKIAPYKTEYLDHLNLRLRRDADKPTAEMTDDEYDFDMDDSDKSRTKRNINNNIQRDVDQLNYKLYYDMNHPHLGLGLRVFGNDLKYKSIEGLPEIYSLLSELNPRKQFEHLLSGREIIYTKSGVFLEVSYEVPLSSGFPLAVQTFGASSIDFRASGQFHGKSIWPIPKFNIKGMIKPSVSLDVTISMKSDYFFGSTGANVRSNLYSSSSVETNFTVNGKNYISLQFGLPQDRNEIISVKSEMFIQRGDTELMQKGIRKRYNNSTCTWPLVERSIGLKVCSKYSLPDISKSPKSLPSLLFCGPISVSVHIDKSDLTAKNFLFEYRWEDKLNYSSGSFIFETPHTKVPRIFTANVTKDLESLNASMSFINGRSEHLANAIYKNTPDEKLLEAHLRVDGHESFSMEMGLNQSEIIHGWIYHPRFQLTVKNDQISGLSGDVKMFEKHNIAQYDTNLRFFTKKFDCTLTGMIMKTSDRKYTTRLLLNYKFANSNPEHIQLDGEIAREIDKFKSSYNGLLKWNSTAYQKYNFAASISYTQLLGHIEFNVNVNTATDFVDPKYNTNARVVLVLFTAPEKDYSSRSSISFEIIRPISNINHKIMIKRETKYKSGREDNYLFLLRYGTKKEATVVISAILPSELIHRTDVLVNVTIPSFGTSSIRVRVNEDTPDKYFIRIHGSWFTGQTIKADGIYQDKSSLTESNHYLKLSIKSPSFNETNLNAIYISNDTDLIIDTKAKYNDLPYGIVIKHAYLSPSDSNFYGDLKIHGKIYSLNVNLNNEQSKRISMDLHLEGVRDIQVILRAHSTVMRKEAGIEIKWDANRDDTQKLVLTADFNTPRHKVFDGGFTFSYPDRSFSASFALEIPGPTYHGDLSIGWSANDVIHFVFTAGTLVDASKRIYLDSTLQTPFIGWNRNSFNFNSIQRKNYLSSNATLLWANTQQLGFMIFTDIDLTDPDVRLEATIAVNSTVKDFPSIDASFKHNHDAKIYNTNILFCHAPYNVTPSLYSVNSSWEIDFNTHHKSVIGSIGLKSPLEDYSSGALATKFSLSSKNLLQGAAGLELGGRKYTLSVEGFVKKITDCMLEVNITTPIVKYRNMKGRFGLIDVKKHFVAEVRAPAGALAVEIKFAIANVNNFDILFNVETPIAKFEKTTIVAKYNPEVIDFRGGMKNFTLGYVAVTRQASIEDFEYSWRVFTPLPKYEESSLVVKYIRHKAFELEVMLKFAQKQIGIDVDCIPKRHFMILPSINSFNFKSSLNEVEERFQKHYKQLIDAERAADNEPIYGDDENDNEEEEDAVIDDNKKNENEDNFDWNFEAHLDVETIIWPTISGNIDVDNVENNDFYVTGNLNLPHGPIEFRNHLYIYDYFKIQNSLRIETPYEQFKEIESLYSHSVDMRTFYVSSIEVFYKDRIDWKHLGYNSNYTKTIDVTDAKTFALALNVFLPFQKLSKVSFGSKMEIEENLLKVNISAGTHDTRISLAGSLDHDENFFDVLAAINIASPTISNYDFSAFLKKDFSNVENIVVVGFEEFKKEKSNFKIQANWHTDSNYVRINGKLDTNIFPLYLIDLSFKLNQTINFDTSAELTYKKVTNVMHTYSMNANKQKELIRFEMSTPLADYINVSISGNYRSLATPGKYSLKGRMYRNNEIYNYDGTIQLNGKIPIELEVEFKPVSRNAIGYLIYSLQRNGAQNKYNFKLSENDKFIEVDGIINIFSKFNWNVMIKLNASPNFLRHHCELNTALQIDNDGRLHGTSHLITPWRHLGIDSVTLNGTMLMNGHIGDGSINYDFSLANGKTACAWHFVLLENMNVWLDSYTKKQEDTPRALKIGVRYINPGKTFTRLNFGGDFKVDEDFTLDTNGTYKKNGNTIMATLGIHMPKPFDDVHKFFGEIESAFISNMQAAFNDIRYEAKYESQSERSRFSSRGLYRNSTDLQALLQAQWGHAMISETFDSNFQMLRKNNKREFSAKIKLPKDKEDSVTANGGYEQKDSTYVFNGIISSPASRKVFESNAEYSGLANIRGYLNSTTPFPHLNWLRTDVNYTSSANSLRRHLRATWPTDYAYFDLNNAVGERNKERNNYGTVVIEAPLTTRHIINIDYDLKEGVQHTNGKCNVKYNNENILNGNYDCESESRDKYNKDSYKITLQNPIQPLGVVYVHEIDNQQMDYLLVDIKHVEVFELDKSDNFIRNITGEFHMKATQTGQIYKLIAIHPNRTVIVTSDYDYKDSTTRQKAKIELASNIWIAYDLKLQNLTTTFKESQFFDVEVSYPRRNLSTSGWYSIAGDEFDSDLAFEWTNDKPIVVETNADYEYDDEESGTEKVEEKLNQSNKRSVRAGFTWRNEFLAPTDKANQTVLLTLRHPAFLKNVTCNINYYRSNLDIVRGKMVIDYHEDPKNLLSIEGGVLNYTTVFGYRNYSMDAFGRHDASNFDMNGLASVAVQPGIYATNNFGYYKRGYLPLQNGLFIASINTRNNELNYHKKSPHKVYHIWTRANGVFPIYTINATFEDSPDINTTAEFYANIDGRIVRLDANFTPDASQNLQMIGIIPDARSASFHLWRNYEEIRIVDISYYLRMNHSRLITSQLVWRPKLKSEVTEKLRQSASKFYDTLSDNIDFWVKTLYSEAIETANNVWKHAQPHTQEFLDDIGGLRVLEDDFNEFRTFLNQSYEANDFYAKTLVNFTLTILDELAIRNHIGSVPKILNEVWQVLGESGVALRKNIKWLMESVKTAYKNAIDVLSRIFHGEAMSYVSALVEKAVVWYDKIIKDIHLTFVKYVQNMWNRISDTITEYWRRLLDRIQPMVMQIINYFESILWNISSEIIEFLNKRTNEIVQSPYYDTVSKFTQELDKIYHDFQHNDALTNIKKYSKLTWDFIREKYFKVVPFSQELLDISTELSEEFKQLQNLEIVQFAVNRINEWETKFMWFAEEFQLDRRVHQLWQIIIEKFNTYDQTALQNDDKYRRPKTYFIFDPDAGLIQLEQKLPMSWHAFNETPLFEEISEFKMVSKVLRLFNGVNVSITTSLEQYQSYLDPYTWLPPFKSRSLLVGSRHYLTFDRRIITLDSHKYTMLHEGEQFDQCSYLLAHDFDDSNFTLLQQPSHRLMDNRRLATRKLSLYVEGNLIDIDVVAESISINRNRTTVLPVKINDVVVYRDNDILAVRSANGFKLKCNLQFDLCWFELSGWYSGKTAGILGTMNNEPFDDLIMPNRIIATEEIIFRDSWAMRQCKHIDKVENSQHVEDVMLSNELLNICDTLFHSKVSQFVNCFETIEPRPFYEMCLDMGSNSISNYTHTNHPAQKGVCAVALAYIEACSDQNIPLRVPDTCVHCNLQNGSYIPEGHIFDLNGEEVPRTADIVFIVEAKHCNAKLNEDISTVLNALTKNLNETGFNNNRFAIITYGGDAPFDVPSSVVYRNDIFSDGSNIHYYFNHIKTGNGTLTDVSHAIKVASDLVFRPGASKTFILLPCSNCNVSDIRFDYSSIHQTLVEGNIVLHILLDGDIGTKKPRHEQRIFGFDKDYAYTSKYLKDPIGDTEMRKEVEQPKKKLGTCLALAIISDGAIFSGNKMKNTDKAQVKKFATVFAKRVVKSAEPRECYTCECTGHNTGIAYIMCTKCESQNASEEDYADEDEFETKDVDFMWSGEDTTDNIDDSNEN